MGRYSDVICNACGWRFHITVGNGFHFYDLHCETCGNHKRVFIDDVKDAYLGHLKWERMLCGSLSESELREIERV